MAAAISRSVIDQELPLIGPVQERPRDARDDGPSLSFPVVSDIREPWVHLTQRLLETSDPRTMRDTDLPTRRAAVMQVLRGGERAPEAPPLDVGTTPLDASLPLLPGGSAAVTRERMLLSEPARPEIAEAPLDPLSMAEGQRRQNMELDLPSTGIGFAGDLSVVASGNEWLRAGGSGVQSETEACLIE